MKKQLQIKKLTQKQINILVLPGLLAVLVLCILGWQHGVFKDLPTLRFYIDQAGFFAPLAFIMLHFLQIVIPFIPGGVVLTAGVIIFGPWPGFCLNYIGIAAGSTVSFALARHYGQGFVRSKVSREVWQKYFRWLDNGKLFSRFFAVAILLPFAPDDALCMLAGLTNMTWRQFLFCILIGKIPVLLVYSFVMLGADQLI